MLSAVTSCLSASGKIMPAWLCWQELITVLLAWSFYRRDLIACKRVQFCCSMSACTHYNSYTTYVLSQYGLVCMSFVSPWQWNIQKEGKYVEQGGCGFSLLHAQGRTCSLRSTVSTFNRVKIALFKSSKHPLDNYLLISSLLRVFFIFSQTLMLQKLSVG